MSKWKHFEDFFKTSGILETDDFRDLSEKFNFDKDNIPTSLKGLIKTVWALSGIDGYNAGKKIGYDECDESWKNIINVAAIAFKSKDKKVVDSVINVLKNK